MIREPVKIINKLGLHARASAKFVTTATGFNSRVAICKDGREVDGKSIMSIMMLAASCGSDIELVIDGPDECAARDALVNLINDRFGEEA